MSGKVLIVDDDSETRTVLGEFLEKLDQDYVAVDSGAKCLALLVSEPHAYDLVLMDIHMPALSGVETASWIKDSEVPTLRNTPVYAVTADTKYYDAETLTKAGLSGVVHKPVKFSEVEQLVGKVMRG